MLQPSTFHRPPRSFPPPVPKEPVRLAAPPVEPPSAQHSLIQTLFPVVGSVGLLGFALIYHNRTFLYIAVAMVLLMLVFSVALRWSQKRGVRKKAAADARRYGKYLREQERALGVAGERQREALARLFPDPGRLWTLVLKRRNLWERRPGDADFLHVRLGHGTVKLDQPVELDLGHNPLTEYQSTPLHDAQRLLERRVNLRQQPVTVDLAGIGILAVTGDRSRARPWTRALLSQLAVFRAPHDLRALTCFDAEDAAEWEWGKWLPHQRGDRNAPVDPAGPPLPALLLARTVEDLAGMLEVEVQPRLEQLRRMQESDLAGRVSLVAPQLVVVLDGYHPEHAANAVPLFRELLARGPELKTLVVLLVDEIEQEPSHVDARLWAPPRGTFSFERTGPDAPRRPDIWPDALDVGTSEALARALTPLRLEDRGEGRRGLAENIRLLDLVGVPSADALEVAEAQRPRRRSEELRVPLGVQEDGELLELDLKQSAEEGMGPHGLLIGATGSGKSELLRTLVTSLALSHEPETVSFVLVDYKGGAAFAELARLPHTAGLITNLQRDFSLVDRMREALIGERERRQTMLREAGNLDDCTTYRARREADPSLAPMPYLLVIVDEFAELLAARPDFIDLFVGLGQVGRSLGIHILFSSQRLDEGRLRGLESHLRYRICLRTYSTTESKVVLGTPDAYLLPPLPGLGYLKVDTSTYTQFKAALVSTPHRELQVETRPAVEVVAFSATGPVGVARPRDSEPEIGEVRAPVTDLQVLVDRLVEEHNEGASVHQVWVAPLPAVQSLDAVLEGPPWWFSEPRERDARSDLRVNLGTLDLPLEQRTEPLRLDFAASAGHLAVVGSPQSGKSTLLRTLLASFAWSHSPAEVQFYCVDLGGGLLRGLEGLPHLGGVVGKRDQEAVRRTVRQLQAEIEERDILFREHEIESMADLRARRANGEPAPPGCADIFLVIDGWATFKREWEELDREVEGLATAGLNYGVHVVVAAGGWAEIRPALLDTLGGRLELRLNDPIDSDVSRSAAKSLPDDIPGRGLTGAALTFQAALPRIDGQAETEGLALAIGELVAEVAGHADGLAAPPVRVLPPRLGLEALPEPGEGGEPGVPVGVDELRLEPVHLDLVGAEPHFLVFGDGETGKSSFLRLLARGIVARHGPEEAQLLLVDIRRSLIDLADGAHVYAYAATPPMIAEAVGRLHDLLTARMPGPDASREELLAGGRWAGPHIYLLIDDYDLVVGATGNPLSPLTDLLAHGRDVGLHVMLARRVGGSARGAYEPFFQRLRELSPPGLLLGGDPQEGPLLGSQRATSQPPGRGHLVRPGERGVLVQTALLEPSVSSAPIASGKSPGANGEAANGAPAEGATPLSTGPNPGGS